MSQAANRLVATAIYHPNPWGDPHWQVDDLAMLALIRAVREGR